jgi:glycosyltransferase involved in cell wall biosynthesis
MHYAVPRVLQVRGLLSAFYTDFVARQGMTTALRFLPARLQGETLLRLRGRLIPDVPAGRIVPFYRFGLQYAYDIRRARNRSELTKTYLLAGREFCRLILARGLGQSDSVYTFNSAGLELLLEMRKRGGFGIHEQTIAPRAIERRLLSEEQSLWPGWEEEAQNDPYAEDYAEREAAEWEAANLILCGSKFVADGLISLKVPPERCCVVPYGIDLPPIAPDRSAHTGKSLNVLFCGTVGLRKGIPYLFQAAKRLGRRFNLRVIGPSTLTETAAREVRRFVDWPGSVPRSLVGNNYDWADVFVLPSICEGSATVCYEALARGLPVITTPNAGSIVREGMDGFIVPVRDADSIADRLQYLHENRDRLEEMSSQALLRAREFTVQRYGDRLVAALPLRPCTNSR